jgi:hypothetical protein
VEIHKPDMKHCVPVGSKAYVHISDEEVPSRHEMMAPRAVEGKLVGYAEDVYGGYLIKTKNGSLIVRRGVRFDDYSKVRKIFSEEEIRSIYNEDKWNEYMFSVRDDELFERVLKKHDNDYIVDEMNANPKDFIEPRKDKFKRTTRSMSSNDIAKVNNYILKPGEGTSKISTPNNCYEALNDSNQYKEE